MVVFAVRTFGRLQASGFDAGREAAWQPWHEVVWGQVVLGDFSDGCVSLSPSHVPTSSLFPLSHQALPLLLTFSLTPRWCQECPLIGWIPRPATGLVGSKDFDASVHLAGDKHHLGVGRLSAGGKTGSSRTEAQVESDIDWSFVIGLGSPSIQSR
eukprot:3923399-Rhodomonas_salina.2